MLFSRSLGTALLCGLALPAFAATFQVTNTAPSGAGSFAQAIADANATPDLDTITFAIPGAGPHEIPVTATTGITQPLIIDGTTQPGYTDAPLIVLSGAGGVGNFLIRSNNNAEFTLRGVAMINHPSLLSLNWLTTATITACYFGVDPRDPAAAAVPDVDDSRAIGSHQVQNLIVGGIGQGNLFRGTSRGVIVSSSNHARIMGNMFGTMPDGVTVGPPTANYGERKYVELFSTPDAVVGGSVEGQGNVFAAAKTEAVSIISLDSRILGNFFGVARDGVTPILNRDVYGGINSGILVSGGGAVIGGSGPLDGNIFGEVHTAISGTLYSGVEPRIQGNYFGVSRDGSTHFSLHTAINFYSFDSDGGGIIGGFSEGEPNVFDPNWVGLALSGYATRFDIRRNEFRLGEWYFDGNNRPENDDLDTDTGANERQNYPLITSVVSGATESTINGTLNSTANEEFRIDFYSSSNYAGGDGYGESFAQRLGLATNYLGSTTVTTNGSGDTSFAFLVDTDLTGLFITSIATNPRGASSILTPPALPEAIEPRIVSAAPVIKVGRSFLGDLMGIFQWFNFTSLSDQQLQIDVMNFEGPDADAFGVASALFNLPARGQAASSLTFRPQHLGEHRATLRISFSTPGVDDYLVPVVGFTTAPVPYLDFVPVAPATKDGIYVDTPAVFVGSQRTFEVLLTPAGDLPVTLVEPSIYFPNWHGPPLFFEFVEDLPITLNPGEATTATITVSATTEHLGIESRQYIIETASDPSSSFLFRYNIVEEGSFLHYEFPEGQSFPENVPVGQSADLPFFIRNDGNLPFTFNSTYPRFITGSTTSFSILGDLTSLAPGDSRTLTIRFTPMTQGYHTAAMEFYSNSLNASYRIFHFNGTAIPNAPVYQTTTLSAINFGAVDPDGGPYGPLFFSASNVGAQPLVLSNVRIEGSHPGDFQIGGSFDTSPIAPGTTRQIPLLFNPTALGTRTATLIFNTNDPNNSLILRTLTGLASDLGPSSVYTGAGPGFSRIGPGGDYFNFVEAAAALTSNPNLNGGDWTFYISGNFTTNATATLPPVETNGHRIVFRPEPGTQPEVLNIGNNFSILRLAGTASAPFENYIFDGSAVEGGTSRDLTLRTFRNFTTDTNIFEIGHYVRGIEFRNLRLINESGATGATPSAFRVTINEVGTGPLVGVHPTGMLVENNYIESYFSPTGAGFTIRRTFDAAITAFDTGSQWTIRDNEFFTAGRAFFADHVQELTFQRNIVRLNQPGVGFQMNAILLSSLGANPPSIGQRVTIRDNRFFRVEAPTNAGSVQLNAILIDQIGDDNQYDILNNMIAGLYLSNPTGGALDRLSAISISRATSSTVNIAHNSINIVPSAGPFPGLTSANCFGIGITSEGFTGTVNILNNIIRNGQPGGIALNIVPTGATINSDYNNLVAEGPVGRFAGADQANLAAWRAASGLDANSISRDPIEAHPPFSGRWLSAGVPANDLHFTGAVGPLYNAPILPLVPVDIDGEDRATTLTLGFTTMGADAVFDTDLDGVPDALEDFAPNNGDGNFDGIPDRDQAHVATILVPTDVIRTITLETSHGVLFDVEPVANPDPAGAPQGVDFPIGFFNFSIAGITPGSAVSVELFLPDTLAPTAWYKFGPTPDNTTPHWYDFVQIGSTGAEITGSSFILHFVDGERGDADLMANGIIVDPGAPAAVDTSVGGDWLSFD